MKLTVCIKFDKKNLEEFIYRLDPRHLIFIHFILGKSILHAIVSWGEQCGGLDTPGVYTRIEPYIDWINETILNS